MNLRNKMIRYILLLSVFGLGAIGCQKMDRPSLGDYPKDTNPPGGPLKFYAALDGSAVDSIRANFGIVKDANFVDGVSQKGMQSDYAKKGYISFPSANDFGSSSDFSISLWINATLDQKDHNNADGILAFGNSKNFWGNVTIFADHEASTSDSMILKFHFNSANNSDNWQAQYAGNKRIPHMYDGNWHNIVITYNASSAVFTLYIDGAQYDQMTMNPGIKFENSSQLVVSGFQEAVGIVDNYGNNSWMAPFPGKIDQVRLYGTTLSAGDVSGIYTSRH